MSYTFGGGTGDDITFTAGASAYQSNTTTLVAGWFYPTTLTATRCYWSCSNVMGLSVDTTTDELRLITDNVTTDAIYTTTGADILVNEWVFIAALGSCFNTGPAAAHRIWVGRELTPPVEVTVTTATAPAGNFTGVTTTRTIGNRGTGTVAIQGDVGWLSTICDSGAAIASTFGIGTAGAISADEAALNLNRWIIPLWQGRPSLENNILSLSATNFCVTHVPLNAGGVAYQWSQDPAVASVTPLTINGATFSQRSPPRSPPPNWPILHPGRIER